MLHNYISFGNLYHVHVPQLHVHADEFLQKLLQKNCVQVASDRNYKIFFYNHNVLITQLPEKCGYIHYVNKLAKFCRCTMQGFIQDLNFGK